jgi:hypothetical protein
MGLGLIPFPFLPNYQAKIDFRDVDARPSVTRSSVRVTWRYANVTQTSAKCVVHMSMIFQKLTAKMSVFNEASVSIIDLYIPTYKYITIGNYTSEEVYRTL